ncbi:MAG: biotin transporter BioY [Firmicutes bacterium]|nr:biotin transporter BioY [Bacillota bacterium]
MRVRDLTLTALFAALTAVGAYLSVPNPWAPTVPFTLQVFAIFLAGSLLGARLGFWSQVVYLALGALGLPVFAGGTGGFAHLLGPTGGYLFSFPLLAAVTGVLSAGQAGFARLVAADLAGLAVNFALGVAGLAVFGHLAWMTALGIAAMYLPYDAVKAVMAAAIAVAVRRAVRVPAAEISR